MGLKRFDGKLPGEKKNFKKVALVLCVCLIAVLSFTSYALYQVQDQKDIANSKVGEFSTSDVSLAIMVDGVKSDTFPAKDSGKGFDKIVCTNGEYPEWDDEKWKLSIKGINHPTECIVYFSTGENAVVKLTELAKTNTTEMFTDDTADQNIRYMGENPSNYVDLGNSYYIEDVYRGYQSTSSSYNSYREYSSMEACQTGVTETYKYNIDCTKIHSKGDPILWRVIGVMNNVDNGTGAKETRLKIIRDDDIASIAWDGKCTLGYNKTTGKCDNYTYENNWATASLNTTLNEAFYNSTKTADPNIIGIYEINSGWNSYFRNIDFTNNGLKSKHHNLIGDAVFYLGSVNEDSNSEYYYKDKTTKDWYRIERSTNVYSNATKTNPTTWTGKIGLMYPSDYGYATSGGTTKDKAACEAKELYNWDYWNNSDFADCYQNDWLHYYGNYQWMITSRSDDSSKAMYVDYAGNIGSYGTVDLNSPRVRPVVYLKSEVKIMSGDGTKSNPYRLGI